MQSTQGYCAIYATGKSTQLCNLRNCAIYAVNFIIKLDYQARNGLPPFPDIIYSIHNFILQTFFLFHSLISLSILLFRENYTHLHHLRSHIHSHLRKCHTAIYAQSTLPPRQAPRNQEIYIPLNSLIKYILQSP